MKIRKVMVAVACAGLLAVGSVAATMAYLTSAPDPVTNTFTVGNIVITLDEKDVDQDANTADNVIVGNETRDRANAYRLIPGSTYEKDPTVHFPATNEDSYVFVKVENQIEGIEDSSRKVEDQVLANGWAELSGVDNVYYKEVAGGTAQDLVVFESFKIASSVDNKTLAEYNGKTIKVTAYAIQQAHLASAADAWVAGAWS